MRFPQYAATLAIVAVALLPTRAAAQTIGFVYGLARPTFSPGPQYLYGVAVDATGTLTPLAGFPILTGGNAEPGSPETVVYDATGGRLYALNGVSNTVSAWSVNNATGALTSLPFSPIALPAGFEGGCISVNPGGSLLVVGGGSSGVAGVASYRIGASTATHAAGSPFSSGTAGFSCAFSRDGGFFYTAGNFHVGGIVGEFAGLSVDQSTGILTPLPGSPFNGGVTYPAGYQTDNAGRLFASAFGYDATPNRWVVAFTTSAGIPTAVAANPFPNRQQSPAHGLLHPAGYYLTTASMSSDVAVFRITGSGSGTTLTAVPGSPFSTGGSSFGTFNSSVVDRSGRFIVTANGDTRNLTLFGFNPITGALTQLQTTPNGSQGTSGSISGLAFAPVGAPAASGDFDADRKADITVFRPSTGVWYILQSIADYATYVTQAWGLSTDTAVPGDYDGDGKTDPAVFRPSTGTWHILQSIADYTTYVAQAWGLSTDIAMPGDYDGDGKTDLAVFRPSTSTWYVLQSSTGYTTFLVQAWGLSTDIPVPADYDGDGKTDLAVFRPSTAAWYILTSSTGYTSYIAPTWGLSSDTLVPADYDGDGKADLAVFRPSTGSWYILQSSTNYTTFLTQQWGLSTDIAVLERP